MRLLPWARIYLGVLAVQYALLTLVIVGEPDAFTGPSYSSIRAVLPGSILAALFLIAACLAGLAVVEQSDRLAHITLVASAALCAFWAGGTLDAYVRGNASTTTALVLWASLAARDLAVTRGPLSRARGE